MNTKDQIKQKALELFNSRGLMHVTLRHVAEELNRSYGNITYYFSTKEKLVRELYEDMVSELATIGNRHLNERTRLEDVLAAPGATFDLSLHYLFLWKDYLEILRTYTELRTEVETRNRERMKGYAAVLKNLQEEGFLRKNLDEEDLHFLMRASGSIRIQFFYLLDAGKGADILKQEFISMTNRLLKPYLSKKGLEVYRSYHSDA